MGCQFKNLSYDYYELIDGYVVLGIYYSLEQMWSEISVGKRYCSTV
jgi:hypothetical protein